MKKRTAAPESGHKQKQVHSTDTNAQRKRLIEALEEAAGTGITTIHARERLDIMMPAARVCELRKMGWDIATVWTTTENAQGHRHNNARYVLMVSPERQGRAMP